MHCAGYPEGDQGRNRTHLTLERSGIRVARHYIAYPGTGIIREWTGIENHSPQPVAMDNPFFFTTTVLSDAAKSGLELSHFTGAYHMPDSQRLVTQKVGVITAHEFRHPMLE